MPWDNASSANVSVLPYDGSRGGAASGKSPPSPFSSSLRLHADLDVLELDVHVLAAVQLQGQVAFEPAGVVF